VAKQWWTHTGESDFIISEKNALCFTWNLKSCQEGDVACIELIQRSQFYASSECDKLKTQTIRATEKTEYLLYNKISWD
jgi:hypothetical protein